MIRLLTATLLVASFSVVADTKVPNTFTDGTPAKASEVNENFDALEAAIDAIPEGPAGPAGAKGDTGDKGDKGDTGDQGIQGIQGERGFGGDPGPEAERGEKGDKGDPGDPGPAGADGADGATGPAGATGATGATGLTGADGATGSAGANGADGNDGVVNGVTCTTDQVIVYRDSAWGCSSPELVEEFFGGSIASCPPGKKVTGGGCYFGNLDDCTATQSRPASNLSYWGCEAFGLGGGVCAVDRAFAICQ